MEPPPPSPTAPQGDMVQPGPGVGVDAQAGMQASVNLDELVARVQAASPTIETVVRGTFRRARRALSIGPTAGYWIGPVVGADTFEQAITVGLAAELFKVPVLPTLETLQALVIERAKAKLKEQVAARFMGREPPPLEVEQMAREIWEESVKEILGLENVRPKLMERPRLSVGFEVNRLFQSDAWMPRLRLGFGVWKLTLAGSIGISTGDNTPIYGGVEVVAHFLPSKDPRADVIDVFFRTDFELRDRDANGDIAALGLRYLLDIF
jgi:hypothetical protein